MSSPTPVVINGQAYPFVANLSNLNEQVAAAVPTVSPVLATVINNIASNQTSSYQTFGNYVPTSLNGMLYSFLTQDPTNGTANYNAFINTFYASYQQTLGITTGSPNDTGDFADLVTPPPTDAQMQAQFESSMSAFLASYPYSNKAQPTLGTPAQFVTNWTNFMTQTAVVQSSSSTSVPSYQEIYQAYFPNSTPAQFQAAFNQFYTAELTKTGSGNPANGYFIPSQMFNDWATAVTSQYAAANATSVTTANTNKVAVINQILSLLVQLIGITQNISASQAQRLNFLTQWQSAYTNLLSQIPTFTQGDGTEVGSGSGNQGQKTSARQDLTTRMQSISETVQALRSDVGDQAQAMQSVVNQSQNIANQQTTIATTILQELGTITSSLFH